MPKVVFLLCTSRPIVAMVAVQGMYSRQKTINAKALAEPNPIVCNKAERPDIPAAVVTFGIPNSTLQLDTTTSLAAIPAMSATMICQ